MMSVKKRMLLLVLCYMLNLSFFCLCLMIDRKGMLSTLRYDGGMVTIICILFLNISFSEMCMMMHRYHGKRKVFGTRCIALNMRCNLQKILFMSFYISLFILSFFDMNFGILFYAFCFLTIVNLFFGNSGRFIWIAENKRYYMTEYGELYLVKNFEAKESGGGVMTYENYRGKECKVRVKKRSKGMKYFEFDKEIRRNG